MAAQQHSCTFSAEKYNYAEIVAASINVHSANKQQPMLIAAHARSEDMILVTNNVREFERVPNLVVENWVAYLDRI